MPTKRQNGIQNNTKLFSSSKILDDNMDVISSELYNSKTDVGPSHELILSLACSELMKSRQFELENAY